MIKEKVLVKTVETDYDSLANVEVVGLKPNSVYYYKISADMNRGGEKVKTPLFQSGSGYVEFEDSFSTLGVKGVFNKVNYGHDSTVTTEDDGESLTTLYGKRLLTVKTFLNNTRNFKLRYQICVDGQDETEEMNCIFDTIIENADIDSTKKIASYVYDITGDQYVFGANYYTLIITAITDDDNAYELELLNEKLLNDVINGKNYKELEPATFNITQKAGIESNEETYNYYIDSTIVIRDEYKVIKNDQNGGIVYIELQDASYNPVCKNGSSNCVIEVRLKTGSAGNTHTCNFENSMATACTVSNLGSSGDQFEVKLSFDNLKSDTPYVTYVYADMYRNNVSLTDENKVSEVYARKTQYTKSALDFSLGSVTPSATANNKNEVTLTFVGASNLDATLVGIDYHVNVEGQYKVDSGSLGVTSSGDSGNKLLFVPDKVDGFPTVTIKLNALPGKELGLNNYIILTYYYKDSEGNVVALKLGEETTYRYDFTLKS